MFFFKQRGFIFRTFYYRYAVLDKVEDRAVGEVRKSLEDSPSLRIGV